MADINYVDYGVLESASAAYNTQAQAIEDAMRQLDSTNNDLAGGFKNDTSNAFLDRYEGEHKVALNELCEALTSISKFLTDYVAARREEDARGASGVSGG